MGFVHGVTVTKWKRVWSERLAQWPLVLTEVKASEQRAILVGGQADLCFVRLPIDTGGLHTIRLYEEVPVVIVPKDHPLAEYGEVLEADLANEQALDPEDPAAIDQVAWNIGVLRVPHSVARSHSRRDLVSRPIADAKPTVIALAWLVDASNPLIDEFIGIVRGRTANSSRTAQARAASSASGQPAPKAGPRPRPSQKDGRAVGGRRGRRRPRGR